MSASEPKWIEAADEQLTSAVQAEDSLVGDTLAGSVWTGVSRATGFVRAAAIAAVLGATYFGNTFQALNSLPNLVYYELLAGSLFASVLVPVLVRHLDAGDLERAQQTLTGFLGVMLVVATAASALLLVGGWVVLQVMAAGVSSAQIAAAQRHVGLLFLLLFVPQVALYVVAGIGAAAMNSRHKFALAAGAPALENLVIIASLVFTVAWFGSVTDISRVSDREVLVLGLGATLAVAAHAALQWWGARRVGMSMVPRRGWHDPDVRLVTKRMAPALAFSGLAFVQVLVFLVAANRIAGGVVALQLALNFFFLPLALVAWPIARALLPQLAHNNAENDANAFGRELRRAVALASFVAIPIAIAYMALAYPLARVVAFGNLKADGVQLLAWSLAAIALGVVFETWFIVGTYACYAREDMRTPLGPMALRVSVSVALLLMALTVHGRAFVPLLAAALSVGSLAGAISMAVLLKRSLSPSDAVGRLSGRTAAPLGSNDGTVVQLPAPEPSVSPRASMLRSLVASLAMIGPAWVVTTFIANLSSGKVTEVLALAAGALVGISIFVGVQQLLRSPELGWITASVVKRGPRVNPA